MNKAELVDEPAMDDEKPVELFVGHRPVQQGDKREDLLLEDRVLFVQGTVGHLRNPGHRGGRVCLVIV